MYFANLPISFDQPLELQYRVTQKVLDLGWVNFEFVNFSRLVGSYYCSYLLPKEEDGTSQI